MKIGLDIDGVCNSEYSTIFSALTSALINSGSFEIFIISARNNSQKAKQRTIQELKELGIVYDYLVITDNKQKIIKENGIRLFIDNQIENFKKIDVSVCCLLVREQMNYDWKSDKFLL